MKRLVARTGMVTLTAVTLLVPGLAAMGACSPYISARLDDGPLWGWLTGERTVTQTRNWSLTGNWGRRIFGGSLQFSSGWSSAYSVGYYQMSDGRIKQVRCDSYTYL